MSPRYAERTDVPSDRSRAEIESTLRRYGANAFAYGWDSDSGAANVGFRIAGRRIRFHLPLPDPTDRAFTHTPARGRPRDAASRDAEYERAVRQRWRALSLVIKAKLEAVEAGISTVEDEFLAFVELPNGGTVGDLIRPQLALAYERDEQPALLAGQP